MVGLTTILAATALACGSSASEVSAPAVGAGIEPVPTAAQAGAISTPTPVPATTPGASSSVSDEIIFVTKEEPGSLSAWNPGCRRPASNTRTSAICGDIASDPFTWIDGASFEVVPLTGVKSWSQRDPARWRFNLREGVTFHNGEPWNSEAAKTGLDYVGDKETSGHGRGAFAYQGVIAGEVVDEYTVDVVCEVACPIFPRSAIFTTFQAPQWWENASTDEQSATTVGLGPYRIVEHVPGAEVRLEAHDAYVANNVFEAQVPAIKSARQVWRPEPLVRAAMIESGEGHLAMDIGFENMITVPAARIGANNEVFTLVADNIWHQELSKKEVRMALAHGLDCRLLMQALYDGLQECIGNISQWGASGINPTNFAPYSFNPDMSRQLLASSGYYHSDYDPAANNYRVNPGISVHTRARPVFRGLETLETVIASWRELGVNAELVVLDPSSARDVRRSGCGALEGHDLQLDCANQPPPGVGKSSHYFETVTSNELLDMQRQLLLRTSCHGVNSRVCNPPSINIPGLAGMSFQEGIADAVRTPMGPDRRRKLEVLAQVIHDEYWFLPFFVPVQVYGLASNLEWEPRYDARIRLNTMRFSQK